MYQTAGAGDALMMPLPLLKAWLLQQRCFKRKTCCPCTSFTTSQPPPDQ
jgi:hypothetical protein